MSGHISIYNDLHHIRIVNNNTKVVSYFLKNNLVIQKDNDSSFFLKNDSYIKYIKFSDVASPVASNTDHLIKLIIDFMVVSESANNTIISVNEMEKADIVLDVSVHSGKNNHLICEKTNGNASSVYSNNSVIMNLGDIAAEGTNSITRQSKEYANIPSGRVNISLVSGILASNISAINVGTEDNDSIVSQIGVFDDNNGIFFQYEATIVSSNLVETYSICKKVNDVTEKVLQANWNVDVCDGNGPSGISLDKADMNTFIFRLGTLPKTFLQVGIMHEGAAILIHEFNSSDFFTKLPLRWHIAHSNNAGITSAVQMVQNNSVVLSNEKYYMQKVSHSAICPNNNYKKIDSTITEDVVFDIKLNSSFIRSKIKIEKINIINKETVGIVLWKLLKNATIINNPSNASPASSTYTTNSIVDIQSLSATQTHDGTDFVFADYKKIDPSNQGTLISSGYIVNNILTEIDLSENDNNVLYADIDSVSDNLTLVVEYVNAPAEIQATIVWCEYE